MPQGPLAYFISFRTYGSWLHGDDRGSVDRDHATFRGELAPPDPPRQAYEQSLLTNDAIELDASRRLVVHNTILGVCGHRAWIVHALHVRTNHVHLVVTAVDHSPERVMNDCKSWCTRRMVEAAPFLPDTKTWARHGSTVYLWNVDQVLEKVDYTVNQQGSDLVGGPAPYRRDGVW